MASSPRLPKYLRYNIPFFSKNCGFPSLFGLSTNSRYFFSDLSAICFAFHFSGPISKPGTDFTFNGLGGLFFLATRALVWTAAHMSVVESTSIADVFVLRHISLLLTGSGTALVIPVCNDCVTFTLLGVTVALVFTKFS